MLTFFIGSFEGIVYIKIIFFIITRIPIYYTHNSAAKIEEESVVSLVSLSSLSSSLSFRWWWSSIVFESSKRRQSRSLFEQRCWKSSSWCWSRISNGLSLSPIIIIMSNPFDVPTPPKKRTPNNAATRDDDDYEEMFPSARRGGGGDDDDDDDDGPSGTIAARMSARTRKGRNCRLGEGRRTIRDTREARTIIDRSIPR